MAFALGQLWWFTVWVIIIFVKMDGSNSCLENERKALLELKDYVIVNSDPYSRGADVFPYWTNDTKNDCCRWEGIECSLAKGHVIGIQLYSYEFDPGFLLNLSLLHPFEELQSLSITGPFGGWFDSVEGYNSLRRLRKLETVDLSYTGVNDSILPFFSAASSLKTLILPGCNLEGQFPMQGYKSLRRLSKLETVDLSGSGVNNNILPFFSAATSLKTLILNNCNLEGRFPMQELKDLRNLEILDLSENGLNGSLPGKELASLYKIKALDLSDNKFSGSVETCGICRLKNLQELDLSSNNLGGYVPSCFGGLSKLLVLDMSENHLNGSLPTSISNLVSLEYLSLNGNNNFESSFSLSLLTNLSKLKVLRLSSISELLVDESEQGLWQPKFQLEVLEITYCNLGEIPSFLKYQRELRRIDLSNNKLVGVFPAWLLENNVKLETLLLESNALNMFQLPRLVHILTTLVVSDNHFVERLPEDIGQILPYIFLLNLSHNGFQGYLPSSVGEMRSMEFLDLSYNHFSGILPRNLTMDCHSLRSLVLSHNDFSGHIFQRSTNLTLLDVLKLDNNQFTGEIGFGLLNSSWLGILDLSNNYLIGAIPTWMATFHLGILSLANNNLEGKIPVSLFNQSGLNVLDLSGNMLSGSLPPRFISKSDEMYLYLHDNDLTGPIPDTFLESVRLLDLRYNKLSGSIPQFLHTQNISILLLGGNRLTGHIPMKLCSLTKVILLDLAYNSLNGSIPSCLRNLSFGLGGGAETGGLGETGLRFEWGYNYDYKSVLQLNLWYDLPAVTSRDMEVDFTAKHRYDSYKGYMYGLDLSGNDLSGEIPKELGYLQRMRALNLSYNSLSGHIPKSFSNMTDLESLDLSFNKLSGSIPHEFVALHSLAVFNVSYNNLSGIIPQGAQLTTFDNSSYTGNPLLCGQPTNRSCSNIDDSKTEEGSSDEDSVIDMVVFYWSLTGTYVTVFAGFLLFLCFDSRPRQAWLNFIDALILLATRA